MQIYGNVICWKFLKIYFSFVKASRMLGIKRVILWNMKFGLDASGGEMWLEGLGNGA